MKKTIIRDITQEELFRHFYELVGLVEAGKFFHPSNPQHKAWLKRQIRGHIGRGVRFFSIFGEEDQPIGFAGLLISERMDSTVPFGRSTELMLIGVLEAYRGRGYGKMLLEYAEELSKETGAYCMYIVTYARDHANIAFYGRNGYIPVATLPDVNGPDDDGNVYMRKIIRKE
jgi:GNAT superfamily N-acetyltransferase